MEILRLSSGDIAQAAAYEVNRGLQEYKEVPVLVLLSGGSALSLVDFFDSSLFGKRATVCMSDERFEQDPRFTNFAQLEVTEFYKNAVNMQTSFLDSRGGKDESLEQCALKWEETLWRWKRDNPQSVVVMTQGMGQDGHTVGVMPHPEDPLFFSQLFEDTKRWVVGYNAKNKNPYPLRVTVTFPFLKEVVDHSVVYIVGKDKQEAFERTLASKGTLAETPARILHEMKDVQLFTDLE